MIIKNDFKENIFFLNLKMIYLWKRTHVRKFGHFINSNWNKSIESLKLIEQILIFYEYKSLI